MQNKCWSQRENILGIANLIARRRIVAKQFLDQFNVISNFREEESQGENIPKVNCLNLQAGSAVDFSTNKKLKANYLEKYLKI